MMQRINEDGALLAGWLRYYEPNEIVSGVMWCVEIGRREPVWTRQLCMAYKLRGKVAAKKKNTQQLDLF